MQNNQNHGVSKCQQHFFSLKSQHRDRRPNFNATVALCKSKQAKNKKNVNKCSNYQGPIFNKDRSHATPTFILPSEKIEYVESAREFIRDHQRKVKQNQEQPDDLLVPKPRSNKTMYCNVCRESYSEYLDHIQSPSHHSNIGSSLFNNYILDLEKKFKRSSPMQLSIAASSQTGSTNMQDDDAEIIGSRGRKKVKQNTSSPNNLNNANSYPLAHNNLNYSFTGPSQTLFYPNTFFSNPLDIMGRLNCRDFYSQVQNIATFNPYFSLMAQNPMTVGYPMYCPPYQPLISFQIFQQNQ